MKLLKSYFVCNLVGIVSSKEEVGDSSSFRIEPVDLNSLFEEDGKIYGYQGLKVTSSAFSTEASLFIDVCGV